MDIKRAHKIATDLLNYYVSSYTFGFDKAQRRFGYCVSRDNHAFLSFSKTLTELNSEEQFIDTVLHEIAHALTPKAHHGREWKHVAIAIGCNGSRCYSGEVVQAPAKFVGKCPVCPKTIHRLRRGRLACKTCCDKNGGSFDSRFLFRWSEEV